MDQTQRVPAYVLIRYATPNTHLMTLFSLAVATQTQSEFARRYQAGMKKNEYWEPAWKTREPDRTPVGLPLSIIKFKDGMEPKVIHRITAQILPVCWVSRPGGLRDLAACIHHHSDRIRERIMAHPWLLPRSPALLHLRRPERLAGPLHGLANQNA
jgi:citrate synthase